MRKQRLRSSHALAAAVGLVATGLAATTAFASNAPTVEPARDGDVVVRAGTIHLVEDGLVVEDGALLIKDGRIQGVVDGADVAPGAHVVDYGKDAVIIPGLLAPYTSYALGSPSQRTAEPGLNAVDGFDFFAKNHSALSGGVTSAYITPATSRLIAGQGAIVKLSGSDEDPMSRVLKAPAVVHGAIDSSARRAPGYWEPPVPATVDVGIGSQEQQLPKSTMGAIVALNELIAAAKSGDEGTAYGPYAPEELSRLIQSGVPWRITATEPSEIRAILGFAKEHGVQLIIDDAQGAKAVAKEIAEVGAGVIFRSPYRTIAQGRDYGKSPDARWPDYSVPAALVEAGVRTAIRSSSARDLLFAAAISSRGGLDPAAALRAITLTPAELYGVDDRVGSLRVGKDADFAVLSGAPFSGQATVLATWVDGKVRWDLASAREARAAVAAKVAAKNGGTKRAAPMSRPVIVEVDELHVGDGEVHRPGQMLLKDGKIAEIGSSVSRPAGATTVRAQAAMPGIIDALGFLGLEGSSRAVGPDFELRSIVAPGDDVDRRVARAGVTTVGLSTRSVSGTGTPIMAYKPAGDELGEQVVGDTVALRLSWMNRNRLKAGDSVRGLLAKAKDYKAKWDEYEKAMASWTPPPPEPAEEKADEDEDDEEAEEDDDDEKKDKKKKKKKDEEEELEPDPITGVWEAEVESPPSAEASKLKMRLSLEGGMGSAAVTGNLRCDAVSETLVDVEGYWDREALTLTLSGLGSGGWVSVTAKLEEKKLTGTVKAGGADLALSAERTSKEYVTIKRPERRAEKKEAPKPPKGQPKAPKRDNKLEPLKAAMEGRAAVVVEVQREDEILDCVAAFEAVGIKPILYGANDAHKVLGDLQGRVAGILLSSTIVRYEPDRGMDYRAPYAEISGAGIPVAFHSSAEEGAIDLPVIASYAIAFGMSPAAALRALTSNAATMFAIDGRVGKLAVGLDADVLLLDGPPLAPSTSVLRTWVNGVEVR